MTAGSVRGLSIGRARWDRIPIVDPTAANPTAWRAVIGAVPSLTVLRISLALSVRGCGEWSVLRAPAYHIRTPVHIPGLSHFDLARPTAIYGAIPSPCQNEASAEAQAPAPIGVLVHTVLTLLQ